MKQCPSCGKILPDADIFCPDDGQRLRSAPKTIRYSKKIPILVLAVLVLGLILVNGFPYVLKRSVSGFRVSLLGISCQSGSLTSVVSRQSRKIVDDFLAVILGGDKPSREVTTRDFLIVLEVENSSIFPVKIESVTFKLFANGQEVGNGGLAEDQSIAIGAFEKKRVHCPLTLFPVPLLQSAGKAVASGRLRYGIKGRAAGRFLLWQITFPFDVKGLTFEL